MRDDTKLKQFLGEAWVRHMYFKNVPGAPKTLQFIKKVKTKVIKIIIKIIVSKLLRMNYHMWWYQLPDMWIIIYLVAAGRRFVAESSATGVANKLFVVYCHVAAFYD